MKKLYPVALVLLGLVLGSTLLRDQFPVGEATPSAQVVTDVGMKLENERNTIDIVERYESGLVLINTEEEVVNMSSFWFGGSDTEVRRGVGSGFFINQVGDILTNFHVVVSNGAIADRIFIRLMNQDQSFQAKVVGLAPQYDLALLRPINLPAQYIKPIPLGNSDMLKVGQKAIAMGAPFGLDFSVSEGIVSSTARQIPIGFSANSQGIVQRVIQTDAAINPGNSGGPLLDSGGRVIGINTQIRTGGVGQSAGVGFAIPVNAAKNLLPRLQAAKGGLVTAPKLGIGPGLILRQSRTGQELAVGLSALTDEGKAAFGLPAQGLVIGSVAPNSPAQRAGLQGGTRTQQFAGGAIRLGGDVLIEAGGRPVDSLEDLQAILLDRKEGDSVALKVVRNGQTRTVNVVLDRTAFE